MEAFHAGEPEQELFSGEGKPGTVSTDGFAAYWPYNGGRYNLGHDIGNEEL